MPKNGSLKIVSSVEGVRLMECRGGEVDGWGCRDGWED